jgi:hypothetical protein
MGACCTVQLPSTLLQLLGETGGAAGGAIEVGLKAIVDPKKKVHRADRLAGGHHVLHSSHLLQVKGGRACGKYAPIYRVGERLFGRKREICRWRK